MYDFNPLATLFLLKALPANVQLPSLRGLLRRLFALLTYRPAFRKAQPPVGDVRERTFSAPTYATPGRPKKARLTPSWRQRGLPEEA